jgi:outer membrane protein assembly factor BamB
MISIAVHLVFSIIASHYSIARPTVDRGFPAMRASPLLVRLVFRFCMLAGPAAGIALADERLDVPDLGTRHTGDDWPAFLGPTGDSKSRERGIITRWPAEGPKLVWKRRLGGGYCMPTISRGRLFQFERQGDLARLTCVNGETGESIWTFAYPSDYSDFYGYDDGPRCSPVVDGDRVYLYGAEGMLHCLRVIDGAKLWRIDTSDRFGVIQNFFGVGSTPVVDGDLLIVQVGGSPEQSKLAAPGQLDRVKPNGSGVVAFDKLTGEVRYQLGDELASYSGPVVATIGDRRWCFVFARGGLLAFEPADGTLDFHFPWRSPMLESVNASNPVVVGDEVFISETYGPGSALLKVRPGEYKVVWQDSKRSREKNMQAHWNTCVHHEGYLYGSSGRHTENAELRCIEWATGKVKWSTPDLGRSSLLYVDGHFVCLTEAGEVLLIKANPEKFEQVARTILPVNEVGPLRFNDGPPRLLRYPAWAAPIVSHGLLYLRGRDRLACLELIPIDVDGERQTGGPEHQTDDAK